MSTEILIFAVRKNTEHLWDANKEDDVEVSEELL